MKPIMLLFLVTSRPNDIERARLPFELAIGAAQLGQRATICLTGDAVALLRECQGHEMSASIAQMRSLMHEAEQLGVALCVLLPSGATYDLCREDLLQAAARLVTAQDVAKLCIESTRVIAI